MAKKFTRADIEKGVEEIVWECLQEKWETLNDSFVDDLGADSLDLVELAMGLETKFGIEEVTDAEAEKLVTPLALIEFVEKRLAADSR